MIPPAFPGTENSCPFLFLCADVFFSLYRYLIFLYTDTCFLYVDSCFLYEDSCFKPSRQVIGGIMFRLLFRSYRFFIIYIIYLLTSRRSAVPCSFFQTPEVF